jgi:hypothetical protein
MVNCLRGKTIKIHVVIHNQLKAPIHHNMTRNAWCAAKLVTSNKVFSSVNKEAFRNKVKTTKLECSKCSWNVVGVTKFSAFYCPYNRYFRKYCMPLTLVCVRCYFDNVSRLDAVKCRWIKLQHSLPIHEGKIKMKWWNEELKIKVPEYISLPLKPQ